MIAAVIDALVESRGVAGLEGRAQLARFWDRRAFIANLKANERKAAVGRIEGIAIVGHRATCKACKALEMCDVLASMITDIQREAEKI